MPVWDSPFFSATAWIIMRVRIWRSWVYRPSELATRMLRSTPRIMPLT